MLSPATSALYGGDSWQTPGTPIYSLGRRRLAKLTAPSTSHAHSCAPHPHFHRGSEPLPADGGECQPPRIRLQMCAGIRSAEGRLQRRSYLIGNRWWFLLTEFHINCADVRAGSFPCGCGATCERTLTLAVRELNERLLTEQGDPHVTGFQPSGRPGDRSEVIAGRM